MRNTRPGKAPARPCRTAAGNIFPLGFPSVFTSFAHGRPARVCRRGRGLCSVCAPASGLCILPGKLFFVDLYRGTFQKRSEILCPVTSIGLPLMVPDAIKGLGNSLCRVLAAPQEQNALPMKGKQRKPTKNGRLCDRKRYPFALYGLHVLGSPCNFLSLVHRRAPFLSASRPAAVNAAPRANPRASIAKYVPICKTSIFMLKCR